jgi:hypothetical protein
LTYGAVYHSLSHVFVVWKLLTDWSKLWVYGFFYE